MSSRLDLSGASVQPFQFPPLDDAAAPEAGIATSDDECGDVSPGAGNVDATQAVPLGAQRASERGEEIAAEFGKASAEGFERGLREGCDRGYAAGHAEGVAAGRASLAEEACRLAAIVGRLGAPLAALERPVEDALVALALEIARCVIGDEVSRSHEFLVRLVREAIAKVPIEMGAPQVLLNPADLELVQKLVPEAEAGTVALIGDQTIEAGGCLVVADGDAQPSKDRRWNPRASEGASQVDLTLPSRWRAVMLTLFDGENG